MERSLESIALARQAFELRETWQGRALAASKDRPIGAAVLSMIGHSYPTEHLLVLLQAVFPGFDGIKPPFLASAGRIAKDGTIRADVMMSDRDAAPTRNVIIYDNEIQMRDVFRRFADRIGLSDADRVQMFICLRKWIVADQRLDPTMDPGDPDAKRLVN